MQRDRLTNVRPRVCFTDHGVEELPWWEVLLRTLAVQFSLLSLLILITIACIVLAMVVSLFFNALFPVVISVLVTLPVLLVWCLCYGMAPEPTKYGTVLFVILFLLLLPLPCLVVHSREEARRNQVSQNLRKLGIELHEHAVAYPNDPYAQFTADNWRDILAKRRALNLEDNSHSP